MCILGVYGDYSVNSDIRNSYLELGFRKAMSRALVPQQVWKGKADPKINIVILISSILLDYI